MNRPIEIRTQVLSVHDLIAELKWQFPGRVFRIDCEPGGSGFTKAHVLEIGRTPPSIPVQPNHSHQIARGDR